MTLRCPRCLDLLAEHTEDGVMIEYCANDKCTVADGVYIDKADLLKFGKDKFILHLPTHEKFMKEAEERDHKVQLLIQAKVELEEEATYWQDKYYNTFDFKVLQKVKGLWEKLINKKQVIKYDKSD